MIVDDFEDAGDVGAWQIVNDAVMGGVSRSAMTADGRGTAVFAGEVSLENRGGFASVRRQIAAGALADLDGLELRVRGDGQRYRCNVSRYARLRPDVYRGEFTTESGSWIEVRLPFAAMEHSVMGRRLPHSPPIEPAAIRTVGLGIGDGQAGPFRLEIDWIRGYRDQP